MKHAQQNFASPIKNTYEKEKNKNKTETLVNAKLFALHVNAISAFVIPFFLEQKLNFVLNFICFRKFAWIFHSEKMFP